MADPPSPSGGDTFVLSVTEFNRLQQTIVESRSTIYDLKRQSAAAVKEATSLRNRNAQIEKEAHRLSSVIRRSRDKSAVSALERQLMQTKRQLENQAQIHVEQMKALKKNIRILLQENKGLKKKLQDESRAKEELQMRMVDVLQRSQDQRPIEAKSTVPTSEATDASSVVVDSSTLPTTGPSAAPASNDSSVDESDDADKPSVAAPQPSTRLSSGPSSVQRDLLDTIQKLKERSVVSTSEHAAKVDSLESQNQILRSKIDSYASEIASAGTERVRLVGRCKALEELVATHRAKLKRRLAEESKKIATALSEQDSQFRAQLERRREAEEKKEADAAARLVDMQRKAAARLRAATREAEKRFAKILRKKNEHKRKKNEARFQVSALSKKAIVTATQLSEAKSSSESLSSQLSKRDIALLSIPTLKSSIEELRAAGRAERAEKDRANERLTTIKSSLRKAEAAVLRLTASVDKEASWTIHAVVAGSLASVEAAIERRRREFAERRLGDLRGLLTIQIGRADEAEEAVGRLEGRIGDVQRESEIGQKQNVRLIRELRSHLSKVKQSRDSLQLAFEDLKREHGALASAGSLVSAGKGGPPSTSSRGSRRSLRVHHVRTSSKHSQHSATSSHLSTDGDRPSSSSSPDGALTLSTPPFVQGSSSRVQKYIADLQADNGALLDKFAKLQRTVWLSEDRHRLLDSRVLELEEAVTKKTRIIEDYLRRERLGRLAPSREQQIGSARDPPYSPTASPSGGIGSPGTPSSSRTVSSLVGRLFSRRRSPAVRREKKEAEMSFRQMQEIMEETLMKNIQIQNDMKIMGNEVGRLLDENSRLKKAAGASTSPSESDESS